MNPYNCTKPARTSFVGYSRLRRRLLQGFVDGNSFAILGGRRCGKTSLLLKIQDELNAQSLEHFHALPRYLDIQGLSAKTTAHLFENIYGLVIEDVDAPAWNLPDTGREYQSFLTHLDHAKSVLEEHHGPNWLVILLIDELDAAIELGPDGKPKDDQFFQNLRNLLMVSRYHRHFRLVASGVNQMANLISSGASPLNNLRNHHLGILSTRDAQDLIHLGFPKGLDPDFQHHLFQRTGRHPYLLQGLLEKLCETQPAQVTNTTLTSFIKEFLSEHQDFTRWLDAFEPAGHAVYQILADASDGTLPVDHIRPHLPASFIPDLDRALTVLSYHGVIDDTLSDEPRLAGTMFRDWYRNHKPPSPGIPSTSEVPPSAGPVSSTIPASPNIYVQVNPTFEVHGAQASVHVGLFPEELVKIFKEMETFIAALPISDQNKAGISHVLEDGQREVAKPESLGPPNKDKVRGNLEQATGLLKSAGATTEAIAGFLEKAEKIAPYLGMAAGWLAAFL